MTNDKNSSVAAACGFAAPAKPQAAGIGHWSFSLRLALAFGRTVTAPATPLAALRARTWFARLPGLAPFAALSSFAAFPVAPLRATSLLGGRRRPPLAFGLLAQQYLARELDT